MEREQHPYDALINAFVEMSLPRDLLICDLWIAGSLLTIFLLPQDVWFLRILFLLPLLLFIPGYTFVAVFFPAARDIDGIERIVLSLGLSIATIALLTFVLSFAPWGIRLDLPVIGVSIISAGLSIGAQYRRAKVPPGDRFAVPFHEIRPAISNAFVASGDDPQTDRILSIILLVAIAAAVIVTVSVIVVPKEGERFTEFFILGENEKTSNYPTVITAESNSSVFIGITNHEHRAINYTVEIYYQDMSVDRRTGIAILSSMDPVDRFTVDVANNQTIINPYNLVPGTAAYNRVEFLIFNETVPDDQVTGMDRMNRSYREVHLWTKVVP
jgi:uncharacterized membrane protein